MFLLNWVKIDFGQIFNQGFRLLLLGTSLLCYVLLFAFHCFMLRPLYKVCGKTYFSLFTKWIFSENINKPAAESYNEIKAVCYLTNAQDAIVMSFGVLFIAQFTYECCLRLKKRSLLLKLLKHQQSSHFVRDREGESGRVSGKPDEKIVRTRLSQDYSTSRFIFRIAVLILSSILAPIHFICANITYLLLYLVVPALDAETRKASITYFEAIKWRMFVYLILSFFMCGFYWSLTGIDKSMLHTFYARHKRQGQFRRMNASVLTVENTITA